MPHTALCLRLSICVLLLWGGRARAQTLTLKCTGFALTLNDRGFVESFKDGEGNERLLKKTPSPVFRLQTFAGEALESSRKMTW